MHEFNWFGWASNSVNHENVHVFTAAFVSLLIIICSFLYKASLKTTDEEIMASPKLNLKNIFQSSIESLLGLMEGIIGPDAKYYFPLIGGLFIYIFLNNLMGIIPGMIPATENVNTNFACSITVFVYYNVMGIKRNGLVNYLKHFMGPIWWLAPLMFIIELISHMVRPASLAIRLFGNITGDHVVLGIFSELVPLVIPIIFLVLGIFVAFVQAFVFSLLSTVYIGLAVAHEEHGHEHEHAHH